MQRLHKRITDRAGPSSRIGTERSNRSNLKISFSRAAQKVLLVPCPSLNKHHGYSPTQDLTKRRGNYGTFNVNGDYMVFSVYFRSISPSSSISIMAIESLEYQNPV